MPQLFSIVLAFHIVLGSIALVVAPGAMATVKGGRWHRRWGKIYFWSMAGVASSAVVLCYLRSGIFLFLIALFSFYLALTGYRALQHKKPRRPAVIDWCATAIMFLTAAWLIARGMINPSEDRSLVGIFFGLLALLLVYADLHAFLKPSKNKHAWLLNHMTRFLAAYIATVTAFLVVNLRLPLSLQWWLPTVMGVTAIVLWRRHYRQKFRIKAA